MTADVAATSGQTTTGPKPGPPAPPRAKPDPDQFIRTAKAAAVMNYNQSHAENVKDLRISQVYIVEFTKTAGNWKATVGSPVTRYLLWDVVYHSGKGEVYVTVYKKVHETTYKLGDITT